MRAWVTASVGRGYGVSAYISYITSPPPPPTPVMWLAVTRHGVEILFMRISTFFVEQNTIHLADEQRVEMNCVRHNECIELMLLFNGPSIDFSLRIKSIILTLGTCQIILLHC